MDMVSVPGLSLTMGAILITHSLSDMILSDHDQPAAPNASDASDVLQVIGEDTRPRGGWTKAD